MHTQSQLYTLIPHTVRGTSILTAHIFTHACTYCMPLNNPRNSSKQTNKQKRFSPLTPHLGCQDNFKATYSSSCSSSTSPFIPSFPLILSSPSSPALPHPSSPSFSDLPHPRLSLHSLLLLHPQLQPILPHPNPQLLLPPQFLPHP